MDERLLLWPGFIIIAVLCLGIFINAVKGTADDTIYNEKYFSKDLALLEDSIISSPSKVVVIYNYSNSDYTKDFKENCEVKLTRNNGVGYSNFCTNDQDLRKDIITIKDQQITFEKTSTSLSIS